MCGAARDFARMGSVEKTSKKPGRYLRMRGVEYTPVTFVERAFYKFVRHPLYLGFVIAFWATPQMSIGHLVFSIATTGYIFVGIFLEEPDLMKHHGAQYAAYRARVPMLFPTGVKRETTGATDRSPVLWGAAIILFLWRASRAATPAIMERLW
jgi:hypothetical protein